MPAGNASWWRHAAIFGVFAFLSLGGAARAQDAESWKEIETKYIFGFTTGSGIGLEGEKEFTIDTRGRFGKRDGRYNATETKYEFEFTPSQLVQIEFGALGSTHDIAGVTDLDDRKQVAFAGGFAELRYLAIERTSSNPLSVTLAFEPTGAGSTRRAASTCTIMNSKPPSMPISSCCAIGCMLVSICCTSPNTRTR